MKDLFIVALVEILHQDPQRHQAKTKAQQDVQQQTDRGLLGEPLRHILGAHEPQADQHRHPKPAPGPPAILPLFRHARFPFGVHLSDDLVKHPALRIGHHAVIQHHIEGHQQEASRKRDEKDVHALILQGQEYHQPADSTADHGEHVVLPPLLFEEIQPFLHGEGALRKGRLDVLLRLLPVAFRREPLPAQQLVDGHAVAVAELLEHLHRGQIRPGLPAGNGLVGNAQRLPQLLLGEAPFLPQLRQKSADARHVHTSSLLFGGYSIPQDGLFVLPTNSESTQKASPAAAKEALSAGRYAYFFFINGGTNLGAYW